MTTAAASRWSPWSLGDVVAWAVLALAGHAAAWAGWWYASREAAFDDQFSPAALCVVGVVVAVFAHVSSLLKAHRRVAVRRAALWPDAPAVAVASGPEATTSMVVRSPNSDRFHRPDCLLVAGKGWRELDRADVAGRPCEVCSP